jgi:hypothetical protein
MEPRRKPSLKPVSAARTAGDAKGAEMVRATSVFSGLGSRVDNLVGNVASRYAGRVGPRSTFSTWQMMPAWRRLACHIAPFLFAALVGYAAVQLFANRYAPRSIIGSEIQPAVVMPGARAAVVYTAVDDRTCNAIIHRWITDKNGMIYDLPDSRTIFHDTPIGEKFKFARQFMLPDIIPPGPAMYNSIAVRWCNPFQEYIWPLTNHYTVPFTVGNPFQK